MWLIKNGVAEEKAFSLSATERLARCVVFSSFEGLDFDWERREFRQRKA